MTPSLLDKHLKSYGSHPTAFIFHSHGDMSPADASLCHDTLRTKLSSDSDDSPVNPSLEKFQRAHLLPSGQDLSHVFRSFNPTDRNSAMVCHIQVWLATLSLTECCCVGRIYCSKSAN
jgi:hypothetical protein